MAAIPTTPSTMAAAKVFSAESVHGIRSLPRWRHSGGNNNRPRLFFAVPSCSRGVQFRGVAGPRLRDPDRRSFAATPLVKVPLPMRHHPVGGGDNVLVT
jgi:hypothetical protein